MNRKEERLAKKYACAFLTLYKQELPEHQEKLESLDQFLSSQRLPYVVLCLPTISYDQKKNILNRIIQEFSLPIQYKKLFYTLLEHKRIPLLARSIRIINQLINQYKNKELFLVRASHELLPEEQNKIIRFIQSHVTTHITVTFQTDIRLINGLRITSKRYLWERSIQKELHSIMQTTLQDGGL